MKQNLVWLSLVFLAATSFSNGTAAEEWSGLRNAVIQTSSQGTSLEVLAAREVRRYVFLRTGRLLPITANSEALASSPNLIVIARKDRALARSLADTKTAAAINELGEQQYLLKTVAGSGHSVLLVVGGDEVGTLYAAYRFAERLGVRFYLEGDVIPDAPIALPAPQSRTIRAVERLQRRAPKDLAMPALDETGRPLFALRGIQPFHDFPEGPDWWNRDDYLAILSQLPKLRMNFFGLHTYPEGGPNAEPTVWIGLSQDVGNKGQVRFSYPASYQNTLRGNWGYKAKNTSDFRYGSSQLFESDAFGADVMAGLCPQPTNEVAVNEVFGRAGLLLGDAFRHARALGIKTCVGTETPLTVPKALKDRLQTMDLSPTNGTTIQSLYEGMFRRIMATYPLDYFWFWTPETWTWEGTKEEQVRATMNDLSLAHQAAQAVKATFQLATCGWVLGPPDDRSAFDKTLPKDWPVSCINREVGKTPVEPGFSKITGRPKWAIPWLEDDPGLTSPQLWVGRMRQDAVDALQYGCNGLLGIHWRTRALGPNVSALAAAAWNQSPWRAPEKPVSGWEGGQTSDFSSNPIAETTEAPIFQKVRYGMSLYRLVVPNGLYSVTLKFCESHFSAAGKRVFSVKLQGNKVLDRLDIFAIAGKNKALDFPFEGVAVTNGLLDVEFVRQVENPLIAGMSVQGKDFALKINCGGEAWGDYAADLPPLPRYQPTDDFYQDWALHQFGPSVAKSAAAIFARIDGHLPRPSEWVDGPGGLNAEKRPWAAAQQDYVFVEELAALRPQVRGAGYLERFDYWLSTFRYMRCIAHINCLRAELDKILEKAKAEKEPARQKQLARDAALPLHHALVQCLTELYNHLLATVSTAGELGTVANWEQHIQPKLITEPGQSLAKLLGGPLPDDCQLPLDYRGPLHLIVPTRRTSIALGESLRLKVIILASQTPREAALYWRPLGKGSFHKAALKLVARGVYSVELPAREIKETDFEYYLRAVPRKGNPVHYPPTAPTLNQTVIVQPAG